jgi:hypothetical protein
MGGREGEGSGAPLFFEDFEHPAALEGWERIIGAVTGEGPESIARLEGGALRLEGEGRTKRWLALQRAVPVAGVSWLRLSGTVRTQGVVPAGALYVHCNLFARWGDGPVQATRVLLGDTPPTRLVRRLPVPEGATHVTVGCFLSVPGVAWFDDILVEAAPAPCWRETVLGHFRYHLPPGERLSPRAHAANERFHTRVRNFLGVEAPPVLDFFKYPDRATLEELTGFAGNAHVRGGAIHTVWPVDRHELVHLLARPWGEPPALLGEGLAVYLSGAWQGQPVLSYARALLTSGAWIPLGRLLDTRSFRLQPELSAYGIAGAFVQWLVERQGVDTLRTLYGRLRNEAPEAYNRLQLHQVVGSPIEALDVELRATLAGRDARLVTGDAGSP